MSTPGRARRSRLTPVMFLLFIAVPLLELWIVLQVGEVIGAAWTVVLLLVVSVVGAALVKREGLRAWQRFRQALGEARLPADEVTDGALVLIGGVLMLTPGFATDAIGLLLVLPPSRAVARRALRSRVRASMLIVPPRAFAHRHRRGGGARPDDPIDVEVLGVERTRRDAPGADER